MMQGFFFVGGGGGGGTGRVQPYVKAKLLCMCQMTFGFWTFLTEIVSSRFCYMERQGTLPLPLGCDASPSQGYPQYFVEFTRIVHWHDTGTPLIPREAK